MRKRRRTTFSSTAKIGGSHGKHSGQSARCAYPSCRRCHQRAVRLTSEAMI
jgi:hypothetical protein